MSRVITGTGINRAAIIAALAAAGSSPAVFDNDPWPTNRRYSNRVRNRSKYKPRVDTPKSDRTTPPEARQE